MPDFKGVRKVRWYQASATAAAIDGYLRLGRWVAPHWTISKAVRIATQITGEAIAKGDLWRAREALWRFTQRELMAERFENIDGR